VSLPVFIDGRLLCPNQNSGQGNPSQLAKGKITLAELCDQYLKTVQHQKAKAIERKTLIHQGPNATKISFISVQKLD
jgi:hypothetical protein